LYIVYDSKTGNVKRFVNKLEHQCVQLDDSLVLDEPYVLITYTTGFGQVPTKVSHFLERNHTHLRGVAASGNKNWGQSYGKSADVISDLYNVPVLCKFEMSGTQSDIHIFQEKVKQIEAYRVK
jgi:protein involved in ribonucleotide reduction